VRHEVVHVRNLAAFNDLRSEWDSLADASPSHSQSVTYQYCELAAAYMLVRGQVYIIKIHDENGLSLLWPLIVLSKGSVRVLRELTGGSGEEYGGPLLRFDTTPASVRAAIHAMKEIKADVFEIAWVDDGSDLQGGVFDIPQPWIVRRAPRRIAAPPGAEGKPRYAMNLSGFATWDDFMATRQRSIRVNHNRRLRQLITEQKEVEFGWCTTVEDAEYVLKWLFANKRRWAEARGIRTAYLMDNNLRNFCIAMARRTDLSTTPLVTYIKVDGVPVAAVFNLVGPKVVEFFTTTYDKAFGRYSVGVLLLRYIAKWAHENGKDFDMRYGHEDYKAQWANHSVVCRRYNVFLASNSLKVTATLAGLAAYQAYDFCYRSFLKVGRIAEAKARGIAGKLAAQVPRQVLEQQTD
jgi:CelD/BcsL family acetyltransferase involved in cellulose biosynthesis